MKINTKENFLEFKVQIPHKIESMRFDKYLKKFFKSHCGRELNNIKQSEIEKSIRNKFFTINKNKILDSAGFRVKDQDIISIHENFYNKILEKSSENIDESNKFNRPPINLIKTIKQSIIFEDENIIVLNKPTGICVQGGTKISYSIDNILNFIYQDEIKIVHRLDKKTTGILIFAKNLEYAQKISLEFASKNKDNIEKKYVLIAEKIDHKNQKAQIFLKNSEIFINEKLLITKIGSEEIVVCDAKIGKDAKTKFKLLTKIHYNEKIFYYIEANLFTGRKHQIRAHLSSLGFSILGDEKYKRYLSKNQEIQEKQSFKEFFLHAKSLNIKNLQIKLETMEPDYFQKLIN